MNEAAQREAKVQISNIMSGIKKQSPLTETEREQFLAKLASFECWQPYLNILAQDSNLTPAQKIEHKIDAIGVLNLHLNQMPEAIKKCCQLVEDFELSFEDIRLKVFTRVLISGNYVQEVRFCEKIAGFFVEKKDQILCLEHIALLYDKRIHHESALSETYERILKADPKNIKALRFFKILHTQTGNWEEAAKYLKMLLLSVQYPEEKFRVAQELAGILLYQSRLPEQALQLLDRYCANTPLNTSTLRYDAHAGLHQWQGCLDVLHGCINLVEENKEKSILWFRIGQLCKQLQRDDEALDAFEKSYSTWAELIEAREEAILINLKNKNWDQLNSNLTELEKQLIGEEQKKKLELLKKMLSFGIQSQCPPPD